MTTPDQSADIVKALGEATTGVGTPDAASITAKPEPFTVRMLALGGPAISLMIAFFGVLIAGTGIKVLGMTLVPSVAWPDVVAGERVSALKWTIVALCVILAVIVYRMASGSLKRFEAKAGPGSLTLETEDPR